MYIRYFWQENHQLYGHIRRTYTVLANPTQVILVRYPPAACKLPFANAPHCCAYHLNQPPPIPQCTSVWFYTLLLHTAHHTSHVIQFSYPPAACELPFANATHCSTLLAGRTRLAPFGRALLAYGGKAVTKADSGRDKYLIGRLHERLHEKPLPIIRKRSHFGAAQIYICEGTTVQLLVNLLLWPRCSLHTQPLATLFFTQASSVATGQGFGSS